MIPEGSHPPHGAVPKPLPKPKPEPKEGEEVDLAKLAQAKAASEKARRKTDDQRSDNPSGKHVKVIIMLYDMTVVQTVCRAVSEADKQDNWRAREARTHSFPQ